MRNAIEVLDAVSSGCYKDSTPHGTDQPIENNVVPTYGEILPESISDILGRLKVNARDVVYDLGSGTGRVCIQAYLEKNARCVGIEYIKKRHDAALRSLDALRKIKRSPRVEFYLGNFLKSDWSSATVIYMCNLCFGEDLSKKILAKARRECNGLRYIVCCKQLNSRTFEKVLEFNTPSSWDKNTTTYVYVPKPRPPGTPFDWATVGRMPT